MAEYINRARVLKYINDIQLTVSDPKKPTILPKELCKWIFDGISTMPTIEVSTEGEVSEDCISRADAINVRCAHCDTPDCCRDCSELEILLSLPSVTPTERTGWIPVSEKNPSQTGEYLVTAVCDNGATFTDKFGYTPTTDGGWYDPEVPSQTYIDWNQHIIAWQPLPEPYEGGDTE